MFEDIEKVLFSEEDIKKKVRELGEKISQDYKGKDLLLISVLRGGVVFLADLIRHISISVSVDFMAISSYGSTTESLGVVKLLKDLEESIDKKHVLVVEDIIDTGLTLNYLLRNLQSRHPASLKVCALLDKSVRRIVDIPIDYKGFDVPDVFVVGYGLDYEQKYRNLPFIGILKPEVYGE
ncbi:MAG: hypoxanthine phosphoribosyltransferase [Actinomycetota bacterium]|nr:hypoxanthine phosphoribosyltransferase [Actinomycetota bacterium]MDI6822042.1 hypoxanthine phosphoribosyltransferase [Actinomycetota bacterium]